MTQKEMSSCKTHKFLEHLGLQRIEICFIMLWFITNYAYVIVNEECVQIFT